MRNLTAQRGSSLIALVNGRYHHAALRLFLLVVIAHWAEHLVQAYQIWVLGYPRPQARGVLGQFYPALVSSEWLHYGYAFVMLVGLFLLRPGFRGRAKTWWTISLGLQFWHHIEHGLLLIQVQTGVFFFGGAVPTSVAQLIMPRVELHLFYNSIVFVPMMIAMYLHLRPSPAEHAAAGCTCAGSRQQLRSQPAPA
jgi:hypothetical protein